MIKTLYVAWQNPKTRKWYTVGLLRRFNGTYEFQYTKGAKLAGREFIPFGRFRNLNERYLSSELFPLFSNRTLPESKAEYRSFLSWLGLSSIQVDPVEVLSRSGGLRATDSIEIFPRPEPTNGRIELEFFVHGVRYLPPELHDRIVGLREGERLYLMFDVQNPVDPKAVAIRTSDPPVMIGYCPRYLAHDMRQLLWRGDEEEVASLSVLRVNADAPLQYRLFCRLTAIWHPGFQPFSGEEYEPLSISSEQVDVRKEYAYALGHPPKIAGSRNRKNVAGGRKKVQSQARTRLGRRA